MDHSIRMAQSAIEVFSSPHQVRIALNLKNSRGVPIDGCSALCEAAPPV